MNCEKCGQANDASAEFCTWCGIPLVPMVNHSAIPSRDLGQIVSHTFHLYGKNFWSFIIIGLPPQILGFLALFILPESLSMFSTDFGSEAAVESAFDEYAAAAPKFMVIGLLSMVATVITVGATIDAVGRQYSGRTVDALISLRQGLSKSWILIVSSIIAMIALALSGILAFILVGFVLIAFLIISWAFIFPLIMIEGAGPISALSGSYNLVKGSRWRVLGVGIVFLLINFGVQILISIVTGIVDDFSEPVATTMSIITMALLAPVMAIGLTVFYFDLRTRKQGLTLDSLAFEMDPSAVRSSVTPSSEDLRNV